MKISYKLSGVFFIVLFFFSIAVYYVLVPNFIEKSDANFDNSLKFDKKNIAFYLSIYKQNLESGATILSNSNEIDLAISEYSKKNGSLDSMKSTIIKNKNEILWDKQYRGNVSCSLYFPKDNIFEGENSYSIETIELIRKYVDMKQNEIDIISDFIFIKGELHIITISKISTNMKNNIRGNGFIIMSLPVDKYILQEVRNNFDVDIAIEKNGKYITSITFNNTRIEKDLNISSLKEIFIQGNRYSIDSIVLNSNISNTTSQVLVLKNRNKIEIEKNDLIKKTIIVLVLIFSILIVVLFVLVFIVLKPIESLKQYLKMISEKNYNFKIGQELIKEKNEFGNCARYFEKIRSEFIANDEKIRYYSKELEISYKEMKNYTYIVEVKNRELVERLKEQELIKEILNRGIKELSEINRFLKFLLKKLYDYKKYKRAELIYKNSIDSAYERVSYLPDKDKYIDNLYDENLKYLINEIPVVKDDYIEIPIKRGKDIIGNLKIEGIELSGSTEKTIEIIANELEIILENAELYYKMDKKIIELSFLNSISVALSSLNDLNELKNMIRDSISVLFGLSNYDLYIYEKGYFLDFKEINGEVIKIKQKKVEDESVYILNKFGNLKIKKEYYIPLVIKERLIGAIRLDEIDSYKNIDKNIIRIFLTQLSIILQNNLMYFENKKRSFDIIKMLAQAIEEKDVYTEGHSQRVMSYSVKLAEKIKLTYEEVEQIKYAGILHDIGKIGISENILLKNGKLTNEEYEIIKQHPGKGYKILFHISSLADIAKIVKYHHERPDGKGYPEGLTEEYIPRGAKILAIADTFDAMTSDRPYRKGLELEIVVEEMKKYSGIQFDVELLDVFLKMIENGEIRVEK